MKGFLIFIGTLVLCAAIAVPVLYFTTDVFREGSNKGPYIQPQPIYHTPQPSYPTPAHEIGRLTNYLLEGWPTFHEWPYHGAGTITISWECDGKVNVYILTQTQYDYFEFWGYTNRYEAFDSGHSGTVTHIARYVDTYYLVIKNPSLFERVKVYSAVATVR